jgi:hypothetical protein
MTLDGLKWNGMGRNGMEWNGKGWKGRNRMQWDGMALDRDGMFRSRLSKFTT